MTGESIPTKENWHKLKPYYKKLISTCMILIGSFLIVEHIWTFGQLDLLDLIGHEFYGIGMIIFAFLWMTNWRQWKDLKLWNPKNWLR